MAAPIFTDAEVQRLIAMPKYVRFEDWEKSDWSRRSGGTDTIRLTAYPLRNADDGDGLKFLLERRDEPLRDDLFLMLKVQSDEMPEHPICEYHIQDCPHTNRRRWYRPRLIPARAPHRHLYNARAVQEGFPTSWSDCADLLVMDPVGSPAQLSARLTRMFLADMNIEIHNWQSKQMFLGDEFNW